MRLTNVGDPGYVTRTGDGCDDLASGSLAARIVVLAPLDLAICKAVLGRCRQRTDDSTATAPNSNTKQHKHACGHSGCLPAHSSGPLPRPPAVAPGCCSRARPSHAAPARGIPPALPARAALPPVCPPAAHAAHQCARLSPPVALLRSGADRGSSVCHLRWCPRHERELEVRVAWDAPHCRPRASALADSCDVSPRPAKNVPTGSRSEDDGDARCLPPCARFPATGHAAAAFLRSRRGRAIKRRRRVAPAATISRRPARASGCQLGTECGVLRLQSRRVQPGLGDGRTAPPRDSP